MIKLDSISKKYGKKEVLKNLSLTIKEGSIEGIVGANGSGKTTLFNCIYKLTKYEGSISYPKNIGIGYMPTEMFFYTSMKGYEFIEFTLIARNIRVVKSEINSLNKLFDLPLNSYAAEYSTGMKKRLILMSILLQKNDFYIMDEPFNGLDLSSSMILTLILKQLKEKGKTVIISSHILSSLTDICDSISYLNNGYIYKRYLPNEYSTIEEDIIKVSLKEKVEIISTIL